MSNFYSFLYKKMSKNVDFVQFFGTIYIGDEEMGRPKKNQTQEQQASTTEAMAPVTDAEREELNRLRKENYQLKMELACTKKIQALVQKRQNKRGKSNSN